MSDRIVFTENEPQQVSPEDAADILASVEELRRILKPRLKQVEQSGNSLTLRNLVGSVRLPSGRVLEVNPKVLVDDTWAESVVQLIDDSTRIAVTGSQRSQQSPSRNDLTTAIAYEYARRLELALRREGPIQVFERHNVTSGRLNGRLDVTRWVRSSILNPTKFPVARDEFTVANDFSRGLSVVSGYFRRSVSDPGLSSRLRRLETDIVPGHALTSFVDSAVANRQLPAQWAKYGPSWDIAAAVLKNRSVIGDPGHTVGLEVAVEPWQLLETLLERTLKAVAEKDDFTFEVVEKTTHALLYQEQEAMQWVIPDGVLKRDGKVVATFEAKYTNPGQLPADNHIYQAITAARALGSPLSIIVYPAKAPPQVFEVAGGQTPSRLVTLGLDLFGYRRDGGTSYRAAILIQLLNKLERQSALPVR